MNSFYLATAKITCPIDPFFTGCWNAENTLFPIGFSYRQHSSNNPLPILREEIQKSTTGQTSTFMVGSTSISRLIWGLSVLLSFSIQMAQKTLLIFSRWREKTGANVRFRAYEGHWHVLLGFAPLYHSLAWWDTRRGQKMGRAPFLAHNPPCPGSISSAYYALPPTTLVIIIICPPLWSAA